MLSVTQVLLSTRKTLGTSRRTADWRDTYDRDTTLGSCFLYGTNGQFVAPPPDSTPNNGDGTRIVGGQYDGSTQHCISVDWPAAYTWSARQYRRGYDGPISWMGSLIYENRDASGLYYRRNRYYDSETGSFTQEDPIGLVGGVNVYGFANGDPLTYRDQYGLKVCFSGAERERLVTAAEDAIGQRIQLDQNGCTNKPIPYTGRRASTLLVRFNDLVSDRRVFTVTDVGSPCDNETSHWCPMDTNTYIWGSDLGSKWPAKYFLCSWTGGMFGRVTETALGAIFAHEFLGHAWAFATGKFSEYDEHFARQTENIYRRQHNMRQRCE